VEYETGGTVGDSMMIDKRSCKCVIATLRWIRQDQQSPKRCIIGLVFKGLVMRSFKQLVEFDISAVTARIWLLAVDDGDYVLEIEKRETSKRGVWARSVCDDCGKNGMFVDYHRECRVNCLF